MQEKERSDRISIEGHAKKDDLSQAHFWESKKNKQTHKWFAVYY